MEVKGLHLLFGYRHSSKHLPSQKKTIHTGLEQFEGK